ncbi:MAG TPA: zf-HC2 domain-containing protein [Pyrinomonadaceae bacterium]|nr:zf-HC2 domain-containing protein [Pyrinomonadaceae bacterium]
MNCDQCQELLSDFLDGTLKGVERVRLDAHLEECLSCALVREEFQSILNVARASREEFVAPPDEHALWLRIRNTIEADADFSRAASARANAAASGERESFWSRLFHKRWELTLPQMATAIAAVAVSVSLVTTLGLQYLTPGGASGPSVAEVERSRRGNTLRALYKQQGFVEPRQASLQYWQQRVEARKANWNPRMREAFDRSLTVLDQTVNESLSDLEQNPHDEIAEQMLNSALHDKIELLREFGEQ